MDMIFTLALVSLCYSIEISGSLVGLAAGRVACRKGAKMTAELGQAARLSFNCDWASTSQSCLRNTEEDVLSW
jgi:hypothetical protein